MEQLRALERALNGYVWGGPMIVRLAGTGVVWDVADTLNGLMALPNLVGLLLSIPLLLRLQREFFSRR